MSEPRRFVISEQDDEETTIDRRPRDLGSSCSKTELIDPGDLLATAPSFGRTRSVPLLEGTDVEAATDAPRAGSANWRSWISGRFRVRSLGAVIVLLGLVCVLTTFAYREHRNARALQKAIEEMARAQNGARPANAQAFATSSQPVRIDQAQHSRADREPRRLDRVSAERRGADLLAANDYLGALAHYRALAEEFPNEAVFADIVMVLELKQHCFGSNSAISETCR